MGSLTARLDRLHRRLTESPTLAEPEITEIVIRDPRAADHVTAWGCQACIDVRTEPGGGLKTVEVRLRADWRAWHPDACPNCDRQHDVGACQVDLEADADEDRVIVWRPRPRFPDPVEEAIGDEDDDRFRGNW